MKFFMSPPREVGILNQASRSVQRVSQNLHDGRQRRAADVAMSAPLVNTVWLRSVRPVMARKYGWSGSLMKSSAAVAKMERVPQRGAAMPELFNR
jgi:hypothetical protein